MVEETNAERSGAETSPLALQLAARVEKIDPPNVTAICEAAVLATIGLLEDQRSQPGGPWFDAVEDWNGARIRKIVRRGRGAAWARAQEPDGVTVAHDGAEVRAFVPGPLDQAPTALAKLQIRSTPLDEPERRSELPELIGATGTNLVILITPKIEMSWGKRAAQSAHAGQWAWMRSDPAVIAAWDRAARPIAVVQPDDTLWEELAGDAPVSIRDGGFTEVPAGTHTAAAMWR